MKLFRSPRSQKGVSLVETMAAVFIFGLVVASLLEVTARSMIIGRTSDAAYTAYNLAKNHLETLKAMPFSNLSSGTETDTLVNSSGVPDSNGTYSRTTAVTTNYTGDSGLTSVTVSVDYMVKGSFV